MSQALLKKIPRVRKKLPFGYGKSLAAFGLAMGLIHGGGTALGEYINPYDLNGKKRTKEEVKSRALKLGLGVGLTTGIAAPLGLHLGLNKALGRAGIKSAPKAFRGVKSQAEAKKIYRDLAMKHHPDRGGNLGKMQDLTRDWEEFQKHPSFPKNAMIAALFDELTKIGW